MNSCLITDIRFSDSEDEHAILVLGGVHAAPEFVAGLPEGGVELGFLEGHGVRMRKDEETREHLLVSGKPQF
jgi:hypothetical protein